MCAQPGKGKTGTFNQQEITMLEISIIITRALTREQAHAMRGVLTFLDRGIPKSETFWGPTTSDVLEMINKFLEEKVPA